jgi:hypothetical protein
MIDIYIYIYLENEVFQRIGKLLSFLIGTWLPFTTFPRSMVA